MADVSARVEGLKALEVAFDELSADMSKRVLRGALRDAARPIITGARARSPVLRSRHRYRVPGTIKRNIQVFNSKSAPRQGMVGVYIRVRRLKAGAISAFKKATGLASGRNPFDPFYWWFLEFGTKRVSARRFLSGAFEAARGQALDIFTRRVADRIRKANERRK